MASLSAYGDPSALRNRGSDRTIFLVEGPGDKNTYERIVGPGFEADVEFRIAPTAGGQGGCRAVAERVPAERATNPRVWGLVDGEVAASYDAVGDLFQCVDPVFTVAGRDGFVFLGSHEAENLFFEHTDVCAALADHAPAAKMHLHTAGQVAGTLEILVGRFLAAALFKYASAYFHARGDTRQIISTRVFGSGDCAEALTQVEASVTSGGGTTWQDYLVKVCDLWRDASNIEGRLPDDAAKRRWRLRVADGKELLMRLCKEHDRSADALEGHLLAKLAETAFATRFRESLFSAAGVRTTIAV
jgi:hypothetical protein